MNWDAIGAVGEIVGAIAVVATLIYLSVQTRHNAASTQSSTEVEASRQFSAWITRASLDDSIHKIWDDVQTETPLSDEDARKWLWYMAELFHMSEGIFIQYQKGFVSVEVWGLFERSMLGFLQFVPTQQWFRGGNSPLSDTFKKHIESLMTEEPVWKVPNVAATVQN